MPAFVQRVTRRLRLERQELDFLASLEAHPVPVKRGQIIAAEGQWAEHAFVLITGWAMSYSRFPDGSHQVRRLHFPGDLLAMPSVPMIHHAEDIEALSDGVIAPFPKTMLPLMFAMPRLAAIMYMLAQAERITAGDRLASVGRNPAKGRIAFLLIDILHRLRSADSSLGCSFRLHLTREQIANVTGMTPVHASRMWSALITEELIRCSGSTVEVLDERRLMELSQYRERDSDFDHKWLSHVRARPATESGAAAAAA